MNNITIILSIVPLLIFIILLLSNKVSLLKTSIIVLSLYTLIVVLYWQISPHYLFLSYGKGVLTSFDIFIIIFGAIFFLEILKDIKIIENISYYLSSLSQDYRIQVIVIAWFFECLIEGTAGFGTPAAIAVPLLIGLGLGPIQALVVGLLGNSIPGIFGAAGTPIKIGFAGLNTSLVPYYASIFNLVGFVVPVFMLWIITKGRVDRKKEFIEALPFAILSGFLFVIPSALAVKIGQEFPSIIGAITGLIFAIIFIKFKILIPKNIKIISGAKNSIKTMSAVRAFFPYFLLITFLVLGKFILGKVGIDLYLGFKHTFNVFNPGLVFIFVGMIVLFIYKKHIKSLHLFIKKSFNGAIVPFLVISTMLSMVQIMINSGHNFSGLNSIVTIIASNISTPLLPLFAPFAGAFGSLMTGSVTVSNVMFGSLFNMASLNMGFNTSIILSLLVVGGGIGNMVALADILTAEAVVGEKNSELKILRAVIIPCITLLLIVGIIGLLVFNW